MSIPLTHPNPGAAQGANLCDRLNCENSNPTTQVCGGCKQIRYCGRQCQRADWTSHKRRCADLCSGLLTLNLQRSPRLSESQRRFLKTWSVDLTVQNLVPGNTSHEWSVPETLSIAQGTRGVILSHQPLVDRFRWGQNSTLCQYLTGISQGYVEIYPSGYDYDLTHTLYHVPENSPPRTVQTADLTIDGVELVGIVQLDLPALTRFLETVTGPARLSPVAKISSISKRNILDFIEPNMNRDNSSYMHAPDPARMQPQERAEYENIRRLRNTGIRLSSPKEEWVRQCGSNWPEYFFGNDEGEKIEKDGGNEEERRYGKGPKFNTAWADYWKWMASNAGSTK